MGTTVNVHNLPAYLVSFLIQALFLPGIEISRHVFECLLKQVLDYLDSLVVALNNFGLVFPLNSLNLLQRQCRDVSHL